LFEYLSRLISREDEKRLTEAIRQAEAGTSGEIRLHIAAHCSEQVLEDAAETFHALGMHKTALRNGVLIFVSLKDHRFAIIGDTGIHEHTGNDFWNEVRDAMQTLFRKGDNIAAMETGIRMAGEKLAMFFPDEDIDTNELSDEISFG
jgi:uncharacterized membrane protein